MSTGSSHVGLQTSKHTQQTSTVSFIIMFQCILEDVKWVVVNNFHLFSSYPVMNAVKGMCQNLYSESSYSLVYDMWTGLTSESMIWITQERIEFYRLLLFSADYYLLFEKKCSNIYECLVDHIVELQF